MKSSASIMLVLVALVGCGDDGTGGSGGAGGDASQGGAGGGGAEGCAGLCIDSGFDDGTETDFMNGLVECQCKGGAGQVAQGSCDTYCAEFGVVPPDALLSVNADKCACDGT